MILEVIYRGSSEPAGIVPRGCCSWVSGNFM